MQLHQLKKNKANRKAKQFGRGGKRGKTAGRGTKGQNARSGRKKRPEMRDIIKRYPKLRGRGRNFLKSIQQKPITVSTKIIESSYQTGQSVTPKTLVENAIVNLHNGRIPRIKIVSGGELSKKLSVSGCEVSTGARTLFEKAGGSVS